MSANLSAILYLVSGMLFILALRGLSSPGYQDKNLFGIIGMLIAVTVTFACWQFSSGFIMYLYFCNWWKHWCIYSLPYTNDCNAWIGCGFHSLVGLEQCCCDFAFINFEAFNLGTPGNIKLASLIEMAIGAAVGAITFSGSIIAFLKLQITGAPIT